MSHARYIIGDTRDVVEAMPDGSVDLVLTSPPFLALRSYLPADHPDKWREIGSEPTPADFLDTLLNLSVLWRRKLARHGSIVIELGDTYAGSGGGGGDYLPGGLREDQPGFGGSAARQREGNAAHWRAKNAQRDAWPMDKSLCGIPWLYSLSLAYGRNLLRPEHTIEPWRVRNVVAWCRPNPPVGALGDKFRPGTSYLTIATIARDRYFDLDAVREPVKHPDVKHTPGRQAPQQRGDERYRGSLENHPAGAPPLDWWEISTEPYAGVASTVRREPCGPDDGGERTTSPDCPVHAGLPGQLPKALRDARAGSLSSRIAHTDAGHAQEPLFGSSPTEPSGDHSDSSPPPTSGSQDPVCFPAATPHSTGGRRTVLVPATILGGTPSAGSPDRTDDTSTSPASSVPHPGTPESRSAEACPLADEPETESRTVGTSGQAPACTCSFSRLVTESTSHYATWPRKLLTRPILSMCPQRVCTTCGEPSRRIVDVASQGEWRRPELEHTKANHGGPGAHGDRTRQASTLGWSDCGHYAWRNGVVLDPFAGSGTTLAVATGLGRDAIGVDIDERNADLARERVGMFLDVEHHQPTEANA